MFNIRLNPTISLTISLSLIRRLNATYKNGNRFNNFYTLVSSSSLLYSV